MKKNASPAYNKRALLCIALLAASLSAPLHAQTKKTRTIEKTFDGKTALWASHRHGALSLKKSDNDQMRIVLNIEADGKDAQEVEAFINRFSLQATEAADNKADVKTSAEIQSWNTSNGKSAIKFKDGSTFKDIKNFKMDLDIYAPKLRYATLENAYDLIETKEGITDLLEIVLYDGKLNVPGRYEALKIDAKYSDGAVGNFRQCDATLYDSDLTFGSGEAFSLNTKYSDLKIGDLRSLTVVAFDDRIKTGTINGPVKIEDKYSEFIFSGPIGNASMSLFDSDIDGQNAADVALSDSKYNKIRFREVNSLHFDISFDDDVRIEKVGALSARNSKYTEYNIRGLWKSVHFGESFDDTVEIQSVGGSFEGLQFEGKYTDVNVPIPASVKYELEAEIKYGKIVFPQNDLETSYYKEKNDEVAVKARMKGADDRSPKVRVKSFDGLIKLQ